MFKTLLAALAVALAYVAFLALLHTPLVQAYPVIGAAVLALVMLAVFLAILKPAPRHRLLLSLRRLFRSRAAPIGVILLGGLALSACANLKSADVPGTIQALAAAGCKGTIDVSVGAATATGLSAGSAHAENSFHGDCDPSRAKPGAVVAPAAPATPAAPQ